MGEIHKRYNLADRGGLNMNGFFPYDPLSTASSFNPTTDMQVERLFDGLSVAAEQNPTGTGFANAAQIEFGPAQGGVSEAFTLGSDGTMTINETGTYRIKVALQFGRIGAAGTSVLFFRVVVNGVQAGRSVGTKLLNSNTLFYFENDNWVNISAGTVIHFEVMRDSSGNDSGGLVAQDPVDEGAGTWIGAPTAALRLERWV